MNYTNTDKTIIVDPFHGHIILLCKGHYKYDDLYDALKRIWEIRCGIPKSESDSILEYIADHMYNILTQCDPVDNLQHQIHQHLQNPFFGYNNSDKDLSPIKHLINFYRSRIASLQIRETDNNTNLIVLPKPKKITINRIIRGNGRYNDYDLLKE